MLVLILALWVVANAMAQGGIVVSAGETRSFQVDNHPGSSYFWVIYNDSTITSIAPATQAVIISSENASSVTANWLIPKTYYLTVTETDPLGCTNTKAVAVVVHEVGIPWPVAKISNPTVLIGNVKSVLIGSCQNVMLDGSSSTGEGLTFKWEPSTFLDNPASPTPIFSSGTTTTYQLTVTDIYGHSNSVSVGVQVSVPVIADAGENIYMDVNQTVMLDGSKSSGQNLEYLWKTPNGHILDGITSTHPIVDQAGKYFLTATDPFGCASRDSVLVNLLTHAVPDTANTLINQTVDINVLKNDIPGKSLDPSTLRVVTMPQNGIATVIADSLISYMPNSYFIGSDAFVYSICDYFQNCDETTVLVLINDEPFFIPEAFSPNGDGINDQFEIKGLAKYKTVEIEIFNRWGNIVYQSNNYGQGNGRAGFWDGTAKSGLRIGSGPVPTGTYFYVLKLSGSPSIGGSIYLDR